MGYDMYLVEGMTPAEQAAYDQAKAAFYAAVNERDRLYPRPLPRPAADDDQAYAAVQQAVNTASDAMYAKELNYYRLNIWGMGMCRRVMAALGMLKPGHSDWPDPPYEGEHPAMDEATYEAIREYRNSGTDGAEFPPEAVAAYDAYETATKRALRLHDADTPGIAGNKLGSNDGWLVTPGECWSAAELWRKASREEQDAALAQADAYGEGLDLAEARAWFEDWVRWLDLAATRGGFEVF